MIKLILLLLSFGIALWEILITPVDAIYLQILLFFVYAIANILLEIFLFFLLSFLIGLPINTKKENHQYNAFYRKILVFATRICFSLFSIQIKKEGIEKLPKDSNFLITFNHRSNLDSMVMDVVLKDYPLVFVAKKSLFKIPFFGKMLHAIGYIKLDQSNLRQEYIAICDGIELLKQEKCSVGISPEGTRNFTDQPLLPFKIGCFRLATKSQKPIVISLVFGTDQVKKNILFKKHIVYFKIVDVLNYEDYKDLNHQEIANLIHQKMLDGLNVQTCQKSKSKN